MTQRTPPTAKSVRTLEKARNHALEASRLISGLVTEANRGPWYVDALNDIDRLADLALVVENKLTVLHIEEAGYVDVLRHERQRKASRP